MRFRHLLLQAQESISRMKPYPWLRTTNLRYRIVESNHLLRRFRLSHTQLLAHPFTLSNLVFLPRPMHTSNAPGEDFVSFLSLTLGY